MKPHHLFGCVVVFTGVLLLTVRTARGCGLDWSKPASHFDGLDDQGHVMLVDSLGNLTLKSGESFPLYMIFNSSKNSSSPYLGQGWWMPFLEAKIVQLDDNRFEMWMPNGRYQFLGRSKPTDTLLDGQGGWKAEVSGADTITAWASCGWKLTFEQGKITSITTPKNDVLNLVYRNAQIAEIQDGGAPILQVDVNPNTGMTTGLIVNGKRVNLQEDNKPEVQLIAGKNVVGQIAPSLSQVVMPDGTKKNFKFSVTDKIEPLLKIDNRTIQWDPVTKCVTKDGNWTYAFKVSEGNSKPDITRTNNRGQSEFVSENDATGTDVKRNIDGVTTTTTHFVNAEGLTGKLRSVVRSQNGINTVLERCEYDEKGRLLRNYVLMSKVHIFSYKYNDRGRPSEIDVDGVMWVHRDYDEQGKLVTEIFASGLKRTYQYLSGQIKETVVTKDGKTYVKLLTNQFRPAETPI